MATNIPRLTQGLKDYGAALKRHQAIVREAFEEADRAWKGLRTEYQGNAAQEIERWWTGTRKWVDEYLGGIAGVIAFLEGRREGLERSEH